MAGGIFIERWDQSPGTWDSGLDWDVNVGPNVGNPQPYLDLITSEHNKKPNFMTTLETLVQPLADIQVLLRSMIAKFDLDLAVGSQLDAVGLWIGRSRDLKTPLTGVYFSFDDASLGFDQGTWKGPFDPESGLIRLPDDAYRLLLRAGIASNQWNGTIPGAYAAFAQIFAGTENGVLIQDLENMHMLFALTGPTPNPITLALFIQGYLSLRPAGVQVDAYVTPSIPDVPFFGFDAQNDAIAGFDTGAWGVLNNGS